MRCHPQRESLCDYSLAISQFAIENGPSIVDLPIKNDVFFPVAMLVYQRAVVSHMIYLYTCI